MPWTHLVRKPHTCRLPKRPRKLTGSIFTCRSCTTAWQLSWVHVLVDGGDNVPKWDPVSTNCVNCGGRLILDGDGDYYHADQTTAYCPDGTWCRPRRPSNAAR